MSSETKLQESLAETAIESVVALGQMGTGSRDDEHWDRFVRFASLPDAARITAAVSLYASVVGLADAPDFNVSCLPATNGSRRAATVTIGWVECLVVGLDGARSELDWWIVYIAGDTDLEPWERIEPVGELEGEESTLSDAPLAITGTEVDDLIGLLTTEPFANDIARRVAVRRASPPHQGRRSDWHNPYLWSAIEGSGAAVVDQIEAAQSHLDPDHWDVTTDDRMTLGAYRTSQRKFRELLLTHQEARCRVCGLEVREVLEAAHLVAHSKGGRASAANGRLLCANHHRAYDAGLLQWSPEPVGFTWTEGVIPF